MVLYRDGVAKACGEEAMRNFVDDEGNVAYWFKVIVYFIMSDRSFEVRNLTCD